MPLFLNNGVCSTKAEDLPADFSSSITYSTFILLSNYHLYTHIPISTFQTYRNGLSFHRRRSRMAGQRAGHADLSSPSPTLRSNSPTTPRSPQPAGLRRHSSTPNNPRTRDIRTISSSLSQNSRISQARPKRKQHRNTRTHRGFRRAPSTSQCRSSIRAIGAAYA